MDKRNNCASAEDITETRNSSQKLEVRILRSRPAKKPPADSVDTLVKPTTKRIRRKRPTERRPDDDELSKIRKQIKYFFNRISYHQTFVEAYTRKGWKNQSVEKIRPEKDLERAKKDIMRYKLKIREAFQNLDHLLTVGKPEECLLDSEGNMSSNDIVCATCSLKEDTLDNDIILCDGACKRGFHQNCLNPPLLTKDIPEGEEKWHCPACVCKIDCIESINKFRGTSDLSISDSWQKVFPEAAAMAHGSMQSDVPDLPSDDSEDDDFDPNISEEHVACHVEGSSEEDGDEGSYSDDSNSITSSDSLEHLKEGEKVDDLRLPSDDSEDDDYDPAGPDSDEDMKEKQDESDFTSDSDDFCADIAKSCHMEEVSSGRKAGDHTNDLEGAPVGPNTSMSHLTTKDIEIDQDAILPSRRRQVKPLDYKKLYDDAYGEALSDSSDGEDWSGKSTLKEHSEEEIEVDSFVHKSSRRTRDVHRDGFHGFVNDQYSRGLTSGPEVDHVVLPVSARQHIQSPESEKLYAVIPTWCYEKDERWASLVDRWLGEDAVFVAKSTKSRANRGTDGTYDQGNRNHWDYKCVLE
ncbi:homeobox protein HOX1A-like [Triticum aestivum]|uniref:homeobox protein HOX1A-like n=1 Tax=Triticum aestivum TaxID=4565 RepID=UPI001D00E0B7|nr:homeobox protein HOX1A-like [Triticum aestivum]